MSNYYDFSEINERLNNLNYSRVDIKIPSNVKDFANALQKLALDDFNKNGKKYIKEQNDFDIAWLNKNKERVDERLLIPEDDKISPWKEPIQIYEHSKDNNKFTIQLNFDFNNADYQCGKVEQLMAKSIESQALNLAKKFKLEPVIYNNGPFLHIGDDYFAIECEVEVK